MTLPHRPRWTPRQLLRRNPASSSLVYVARHYAAEAAAANIVEKRSHDEDNAEQRQPAGPVVGEQPRQMVRDIALLEMIGEQLEADEKQKKIGDNHPFVFEMTNQGLGSGSCGKGAEERLVGQDDQQPSETDLERAFVKQRHAQEHQRE